jgi:hypothetical protein
MQYEDRIRRERPDMSKSFAKLADFLLNSYIEAAFMTASELAHALKPGCCYRRAFLPIFGVHRIPRAAA